VLAMGDIGAVRAHSSSLHDQALFEASLRRGMEPVVVLPFSAASFTFVFAKPGSEIARG
jgi:hypothetical protein